MKRLFLLPIIMISFGSIAQDASEETSAHTIKSSYDDMLDKSNRYQEFKVVKRTRLASFITEVQDSLDVIQKRFQNEVRAKKNLETEVASLNETISAGNNKVSELESQRDSISTLGMDVNKSAFATGMWITVLALLGLLIALFLRNKSMAFSQKAVRANLNDIEDELSVTKKKALEREQELKREVQDYVNKIEAMGPPR